MDWISVNDYLPEELTNVLVYARQKINDLVSESISVAFIIPEGNRGKTLYDTVAFWLVEMSEYQAFSFDEVTHWMPLPTSPLDHNESPSI